MTFEAELMDALGDASDAFDIRASVRRCWFFDIDGYPLRVWEGHGELHAGGEEWIGSLDEDGRNRLTVPNVQDPRAGASPRYTFTIPYLDLATFDALKADQDLVRGRDVTCYHVIVKHGEGLRPGTALRFNYRMTMLGTTFTDEFAGDVGQAVRVRSASVLCASSEAGRSRIPAGLYNDASQQERARLLGVASDSFCAFVASNSRRTLTIEGT